MLSSCCLLTLRPNVLLTLARRGCHNQSNTSPVVKGVRSFRKYVLTKYLEYVANYEKALEKRFPAAWRIYRVFKIGITDFYGDTKLFMGVARKLGTNKGEVNSLSRHELEIFFKMPKDMFHIAPVLLVSALPLVNYVVFPLAYMFPKQLLTSHFWSLQQRTQFAVLEQKNKLHHYKPVFRCLQAGLSGLEKQGSPLTGAWNVCLAMLGSGLHPSHQSILACEPLFASNPYSLKHISSKHLRELARMHGINSWFRRRHKLSERARQIQLLDLAIDREGGISSLSLDEIRSACFLRGLNPTFMNSQEAANWLSAWIYLSKALPPDSPSLLLHAPILLAYNHPSNWVLIH